MSMPTLISTGSSNASMRLPGYLSGRGLRQFLGPDTRLLAGMALYGALDILRRAISARVHLRSFPGRALAVHHGPGKARKDDSGGFPCRGCSRPERRMHARNSSAAMVLDDVRNTSSRPNLAQ